MLRKTCGVAGLVHRLWALPAPLRFLRTYRHPVQHSLSMATTRARLQTAQCALLDGNPVVSPRA